MIRRTLEGYILIILLAGFIAGQNLYHQSPDPQVLDNFTGNISQALDKVNFYNESHNTSAPTLQRLTFYWIELTVQPMLITSVEAIRFGFNNPGVPFTLLFYLVLLSIPVTLILQTSYARKALKQANKILHYYLIIHWVPLAVITLILLAIAALTNIL